MGHLNTEWLRQMPAEFKLSDATARSLEKVRRRHNLPDEKMFTGLILASPPVLQWFCENMARTSTENWKLDQAQAFAFVYVVEVAKQTGVRMETSHEAFQRWLGALLVEHQVRVKRMSAVVNNLEDLVRYIILERGSYSEVSQVVREIVRDIDLAFGWFGYAAFSHLPPTNPKPPNFDYTFSNSLNVIRSARDVLRANIEQTDSLVIFAYQVAARLNIHPYQAICVFAGLNKSIELREAGYSGEKFAQELLKSGL